MTFDLLLGQFEALPQIGPAQGILVRALDFVFWGISQIRKNEILRQWGESDRHYDWAVCDGLSDELLLFDQEKDLIKFEFFTCDHPVACTYRVCTQEDREAFGISQASDVACAEE